jgi:hypothetical protein
MQSVLATAYNGRAVSCDGPNISNRRKDLDPAGGAPFMRRLATQLTVSEAANHHGW